MPDPISENIFVGLAGTPGQGNFMELTITVVDAVITDCEFRCHPCSFAHKLGRSLVKHVGGTNIDQVIGNLHAWIKEVERWLPTSKKRVLGLTLEATTHVIANAINAEHHHDPRPRED